MLWPPLPPPQPAKAPSMAATSTSRNSFDPRLRAGASENKQPKNAAKASAVRVADPLGIPSIDEVVVVVAVVLIDNIDVVAVPLGVTLAGDSPHEESEGRPAHAKVTAWMNPFTGVTVS